MSNPSSTTATDPAASAPDDSVDVMALAQEADNSGLPLGAEAEVSAPSTAAAAPSETGTTAQPRAAGSPTEAQTQPGKPAQQPEPSTKPDSKFMQAKKDADRRDRSWQALDKEKDEFRTEREQLRTEVERLRRSAAPPAASPSGSDRDAHGATAQDYDQLAETYAAEGRDDMAEAARNRAQKLRTPAPAAAATVDPVSTPEFQSEWKRHTAELIQADPDLANPESTVVKAANTLLADSNYGRFFRAHPDGIRAAVEVARLMRANAESAQTSRQLITAQEQLKAAQQENDRLNALLQPRGSHPAGPTPGERTLDQMTDSEADAFMRRLAASADRGEIAA